MEDEQKELDNVAKNNSKSENAETSVEETAPDEAASQNAACVPEEDSEAAAASTASEPELDKQLREAEPSVQPSSAPVDKPHGDAGSIGHPIGRKTALELVGMVGIYIAATVILFLIGMIAVSITGDQSGFPFRFATGAILAAVSFIAPFVILIVAFVAAARKKSRYAMSRYIRIANVCVPAVLALTSAAFAMSNATCTHVDSVSPTCTQPGYCGECGAVTSDPLGHDWVAATCTAPKTCSRCGLTEGQPVGHQPSGDWTVTKEATCSETGTEVATCAVCGEQITQEIPKAAHTPGEMTVVQQPIVSFADGTSYVTPGKREQKCTVCGQVVSTEEYQPADAEIESIFKDSCSEFSYDDVARNPDNYNGNQAVFSGRVVQVMQQGNTYVLRVNKDNDYDCTMYVTYYASVGVPRILEDDYLTIWGTLEGLATYQSIFGASITIPKFDAAYVQVQ